MVIRCIRKEDFLKYHHGKILWNILNDIPELKRGDKILFTTNIQIKAEVLEVHAFNFIVQELRSQGETHIQIN